MSSGFVEREETRRWSRPTTADLGHIFDCGADGYEAVDRDWTRLGFFSDQRAALDAFDALVVGEDEPPF